MTLPQKIQSIRKKAGLNQAEFGDVIGVTQGQVSKWERPINAERPSIDLLHKIAKFAKLRLDDLTDAPTEQMLAPVIGFIGASGEMFNFPKNTDELEAVPAPEGSNEATVALKVADGALGPTFDGWHVFYDKIRTPPSDAFFNRLCVVGHSDGRVLVRTIQRGQISGMFTLNPVIGPPSYDQKIEWISPVRFMSQP